MTENEQQMRQQLDETKAQLFAKLQLLEEQIADSIETTGTKVKSTVGAVESAVHSVANALNIRSHFEHHPWWWLGGALAAGYIAGGARRYQAQDPKETTDPLQIASLDSMSIDDSSREQASQGSLSALSAAFELGSRQSTANQARTLLLNATVRIFEEIVSRSVPIMISRFVNRTDEK